MTDRPELVKSKINRSEKFTEKPSHGDEYVKNYLVQVMHIIWMGQCKVDILILFQIILMVKKENCFDISSW